MAYNEHWDRWVYSSVAYHLKTLAQSNNLAALVEGLDQRDQDFMEADDRVEIRVNGPFSGESSKGYWRIDVEVNLLFTSRMGGPSKDRNTIHVNTGVFHKSLQDCVPVHKYGNGPDDDQSRIGYLRPEGREESVRKLFFGQVNQTDGLVQGGVDARLVMFLTE